MGHYSRAGGTRQSRTKPGQFETEKVRVDPLDWWEERRPRESQLTTGWTRGKVKSWDILSSNDHKHHCRTEQSDRHGQLYVLMRCSNSHHPEIYSAHFNKDRELQPQIPPHLRVLHDSKQLQSQKQQDFHNLAGTNSCRKKTWSL